MELAYYLVTLAFWYNVRVKLGSEISCKNDRHSSVKFSEVVVMVTSVAIVSCGCCFLFLLLFTCV